MIVYVLIDPRTGLARYVGKTIQTPDMRLAGHLYGARRKGYKSHVSSWIRSLLNDGLRPVLEQLERATSSSELLNLERFWIANFRAVGVDLTNCTDGGDGREPGFVMSTEQKAKISKTMTGKIFGPCSEERKAKIGTANRGRKQTEASNILRSRINGGRPVIDSLGRRWETTRGLCRELNLRQANVVACLKGRAKTHKGLTFRYAD